MRILFFTLAIVALLAGCAGTHPVHYYTIDMPAAPPGAAKPDGLAVVVGLITTPEALQDGRIRYRAGANEVGAYEYHRWTERPGVLVRNALVGALRATGHYRRVMEASSATTGDYLLRGRLHVFDEVDGAQIETKISLHVELIDLKTNRDVWDLSVQRSEPVSGKTVPEVVASMDRNLREVAGQIAAGIDQFLAGRR